MRDEVKDMKSTKMMLTDEMSMRMIMTMMMMSVRINIYNKSDVWVY